MTYLFCKKIIAGGNYDKKELLEKLDVFLLANRITEKEYTELTELINAGKE